MKIPTLRRDPVTPDVPAAPAASVSPDEVVRAGVQDAAFAMIQDTQIRRSDLDLDQNLVSQIRVLLAKQ